MEKDFHIELMRLIMRTKNEEMLKAILEFINDWYFENNVYPTLLQIAKAQDIGTTTAHRYVTELIARGKIEKNSRYGGLQTKEIMEAGKPMLRLPVVGEIACGLPLLAEENIEYYVNFPRLFLGNGEYFILCAKGNSMINAGINSGDMVIIRKQENAEEGQIVVALIDNEATLKRFYVDKKRRQIRLHPENDDFEDMYFENVSIQGIAVKVLKDLK